MVKLMNEAKSKMSALRAEVLALEGEGNKLRKNDEAVSREIDTFIDATIEKHTAIMERERQRLKQEVHAKTAQQLCKLQEQKESLVESLSSMEFVSNSVDSTKKIEFLRSKKEIESKLAGLKSFAQEFHPCEKVLYKLDKTPFEEENMQGVANIDTQTEYCLSMTGGEPGVIYTGRVWQWCEFTLTVNSDVATHHRNALNDFRVTVLAPNEEIPFCRCVEDKGNGSCGFGFRPAKSGDHKIFIHNEKLFGGEAHCSPLTWKVLPPFCLRSWIFWLGHCISFVFRDYKYLRDCLYEDGQHSWRIRMVGQREPQDLRQRGPQDHSVPVFIQIGVVNPFKDLGWYWQNSQHISPGSGVPSSVKSLHRGDVLVCFLDMRKKQLVMYNERTKESDIWRDIKGPVTPYLSPDAFLYDVYFSVGE